MAKDLVIVESPAKARTVGRFLGKNYDVKASMGHVRDLPRNLPTVLALAGDSTITRFFAIIFSPNLHLITN